MKKAIAVIILGLMWCSVGFAGEKKESIYLECKTDGPYDGYGLFFTNNTVLAPSWDKEFNIVPLKITPARYNFEYYPREGMPMKFIISINRFTGELIKTIETELEGKKELHTFNGKCIVRDLDKPEF